VYGSALVVDIVYFLKNHVCRDRKIEHKCSFMLVGEQAKTKHNQQNE
jgi:hypothetical protein